MPATRSRNVNVLRTIQDELAPFPGRFGGSVRDALGIVIALVVAMTLRVPGIALALSVLFLLQRDRPGLTLRSATQVLSGVASACAVTLFWVQLTDGTEMARYLGLVLGIFIAAFGMATTSLPLFFTMFGFFGFIDLAAWDSHRSPNAIVTSSLYGVAALSIVALSAVAIESLFGIRHPYDELKREVQTHLSVLSRFFHFLAQDPSTQNPDEFRSLHSTLVQSAHVGDARMNELYNRVRNTTATLSAVPLGMHYRIGLLARVLEKSSLIGFNTESKRNANDRAYYAAIAAQCDSLEENIRSDTAIAPSHSLPASSSAWLIDIHTELRQYADNRISSEGFRVDPIRQTRRFGSFSRLFVPGAVKSRDSATYALKLTLAATLCYTVYNAIAWPGILTCVVTVLFTGLSPTGQMKQKQAYRFLGTAVGGVLAISAESLLFPNMDSITSLVVVVAAVAFIAGWVLRSPHIGSVGTQIGFAFFLTTLQEFRATSQIATARDRVVGVTLGILVMWFVFDQLWPTRTSQTLSQILRRIQDAALQLHQISLRQEPRLFAQALSRLRVSVSLDLASMQQLESAAYFDFGRGHIRELAQSRRLIRKIETAAAEFYTEALHQRDKRMSRSL